MPVRRVCAVPDVIPPSLSAMLPGTHPVSKRRPKYLNLFKIHQPIIAVISVAHRISGILLVLLTPVLIYGLQRSLHDAQGFAAVRSWFDALPVRVVLLVATWALSHHLFTGLRHLYLDMGWGTALRPARRSAWAVGLLALVVTALVGAAGVLW